MSQKFLIAEIESIDADRVRLAYLDHTLPSDTAPKGIIVLLHGFPQTSYQFRHAIPLLVSKGYRCIAPDYRGAGGSTKAVSDFRKTTMADDMIALLDYLSIMEPIYIVGHDIGGMIAFVLASRYPDRVKSVCWGECPLPGTKTYYRDRTENPVQQFHFIFHSVPDLPEALVAGRERIYITHFFNKISYNLAALSDINIDHYTRAYEQPGAMRSAFGVYRAFKQDAEENKRWIAEHGKCKVPTLILSGEHSRHQHEAEEMALEVIEKDRVEMGLVAEAGHYLAEENPSGFANVVLDFLQKH